MRLLLMAAMVIGVLGPPALAQDPTVVDAKHYRVILENDQVRVLRITYGPGEKSVMHVHPDSIAVFLSDSRVRFTMPDGTSMESQSVAGQSEWTPAGTHLPVNTGSRPIEVVLVELKAGSRTPAARIAADTDPARVASAQCTVDFENDRVRVLRWKLAPNGTVAMHRHPASVSVVLTDGASRFTLADGTTRNSQAHRGDVTWSAPEAHASQWLGTTNGEVIQIELKQ